MREIIFRGRRNPASDFVCGHLIRYKNEAYILTANEVSWNLTNNKLIQSNLEPVDPETVGQYTGVDDKNGKPIFEGDIIHYDTLGPYSGPEYYIPHVGPVIFSNQCFLPLTYCVLDTLEVVGNVYDNPEMCKEE